MYRKTLKVALVLIYLVIIAGAVVRMTGSGMGCPDWPKCFGYYIPPTEEATLLWDSNREFKKGNVIIVDRALQVAKQDFVTALAYDQSNWEPYTEHDYATFNVWHTWIEYINRLLGALSGLAILIMAILSIWKWNQRKRITLISWQSVGLIGFQGWLGATVVYSVLAPVRITIHMVMALIIVGVLLYLLHLSKEKTTVIKSYSKRFKWLLGLSLLFTLIQIVLGTQVRQLVDDQVAIVGYEDKSAWLQNPTLVFYLHRSFSILVVLVNVLLWRWNSQNQYNLKGFNGILALLTVEALTGILMYYLDFPFLSQPLHLVIATLLFGIQCYLFLQVFTKEKLVKLS